MIHRYTKGYFNSATQSTIGAAYCKKTVQLREWNVALQIWDTAGQERFRSMGPMYYRNARAAVMVFDATDESTLEKIDEWMDEVYKHANKDVIFVLAGNKCDVKSIPPTTIATAQAKATKLGAQLFHTSAKSGKGVQELFQYIAQRVLDIEIESGRSRDSDIVDLSKGGGSGGSGGGCCSIL